MNYTSQGNAALTVVVDAVEESKESSLVLRGLVLLAQFHGVAADVDQLAHEAGAGDGPLDDITLVLLTRKLGLKAKVVTPVLGRLAIANLPALTLCEKGDAFIITRINGEQALIHDLSEQRPQTITAVSQRRAELETAEASIVPLEEATRITRMRAEDYGRLVKGKYVGRHDYLLREQERIAAERDLLTQRNRAREIRSALLAAAEELKVLVTDFRQQALNGLREAEEQIGQMLPELSKAAQRNGLMALRAPVAGTVQQLSVHTVGGVVTPAQPLLVVVPSGEALEIEATVLNKDIGFVQPGQLVTVKVDGFPYTRYGYLTGKVVSVSHDATQDEKLGLVFPARVHLDRTNLNIDGVSVRLSAGMSLSAEIKTGKRRVVDYLIGPLKQHATESLRER